jgi:hypothetical protein
MNDGQGGSDYFDIQQANEIMPNVRKFLVSGLQTGLNYGFTVQALNFNGPS